MYSKVQQKNIFNAKQEKVLATKGELLSKTNTDSFFYEIEPAIVLDIILDHNHPIFNTKKIDPSEYPNNADGSRPKSNTPDYSWIGRAKVRQLYSEQGLPIEKINWAIPLYENQETYPLINEMVLVTKQNDQYYYTRTVNLKNIPNTNGDFRLEQRYGMSNTPYTYAGGVSSKLGDGSTGKVGQLGLYFKYNPNIRLLKRFEGDTLIESKFGSSIRIGGYGTNTNNVNGEDVTDPNIDQGIQDYANGMGNPQIIIRNRQRPIKTSGTENISTGRILEDINNDGTAIHITSGKTISKWQSVITKAIFSTTGEEIQKYSPSNSTTFSFPSQLTGNQLIANSDRIILQSKTNETFILSKKRLALATDSELTLDAAEQIIITSNDKTVVNSQQIYLGEYNQNAEPCLLGATTIDWLTRLCNWLETHTHWYHHVHNNQSAGQADPLFTQYTKEYETLILLKNELKSLASNRVFVTGGGKAP